MFNNLKDILNKKKSLSECQNYQTLTGADRKTSYRTVGKNGIADRMGPGWFRFQGAAGTRMATSCPPLYRCNTNAPGWLNGGHPTLADGQVTKQVCFNWHGRCCYDTINVEVRNCGSYYVYYLRVHGGTTRYCGSD